MLVINKFATKKVLIGFLHTKAFCETIINSILFQLNGRIQI